MVWLHKILHETDPIETSFEKELRQRFLAAVEIAATRRIAGYEMPLVITNISREATSDGSDIAGVQRVTQYACDISLATRPLRECLGAVPSVPRPVARRAWPPSISPQVR